ncbi:MAG: hypothetical protein Q8R08_03545, partial [bacterium]|nr:hypothetical protein [bacterium]
MQSIVFFDGKFLPVEKALLPVTDLAVQRGVGVFETMRTYGKRPFLLEERVGRLLRSARRLGIASSRPRTSG